MRLLWCVHCFGGAPDRKATLRARRRRRSPSKTTPPSIQHKENGCISAQPHEDAHTDTNAMSSTPPADTSAKRSCPELVGELPAPASEVIKAERPDLRVQVLPAGTMATMEFNDGRVRLWLGADGKVSQTPSIG